MVSTLFRPSIYQSQSRAYFRSPWVSKAVVQSSRRPSLKTMFSHFACCLGDTLASELGILSPTPPILITTLKPVPPGTNGAMSLGGTLASILGGLIMGATMLACLLVESSKCREGWTDITISLLVWGAAAGGFGSLVSHFDPGLRARALSMDWATYSSIHFWEQPSNRHGTLQIQSGFYKITLLLNSLRNPMSK